MADNVVKFPTSYYPPPISEIPDDRTETHHEQIFEFDDGSYMVMVLPKKKKFTIERVVLMAERLKMTAICSLPPSNLPRSPS